MSKVLGLDVGYASLGWAVVDTDEQNITAMGVRIFTEGVANINSSQEQTRNAQRRMKRRMRRQYERARERRLALRKYLTEQQLLPSDGDALQALFATDPYDLRARGLDHQLSLHEIGRVIDHINARRGFRSNRKVAKDDDEGTIYEGSNDSGMVGINQITQALDSRVSRLKSYTAVRDEIVKHRGPLTNGFRTAGEYLASLNPHEVRRRKRFMLREHLEIELDLLLRKQAAYYPQLTPEVIHRIAHLVFWQRPLQSVRHLVGKCQFEPGKKRAHKSHPDYQRFRMLQQVNTLEVYGPGRVLDDDRKLTPKEREKLITYLTTEGKSVNLNKDRKKIYKTLGLTAQGEYTFNLETLNACTTVKALRDIFGADRIVQMTRDEINEIWNVFNMAEDNEWLEEYAKTTWGLTAEQAKKATSLKLEDGYGSVSLRAARKILEYLEDGWPYHEACARAGYHHSKPDVPDENHLEPRVRALAQNENRNPIVQRSFSEMRKVVNALLDEYGPFDSIRVELGRELRKPKNDRLEIDKRNKKNRDENDIIREKLKTECRLETVSRADLERYKLWEQQNHQCIYTGKQISLNELFGGQVDVDHVLPYSRTLDDSRANKVVCTREANARKGNLTPAEACGRGIFDAQQLRERVEALARALKIDKQKASRFFIDDEGMAKLYGDDFTERALNDTRYVGRLTATYLRYVCKDVIVSNGTLTDRLRRRWELDAVIPDLAKIGRAWLDEKAHSNGQKSRADHRHHAIDALVVALTDRSLIKRLSTLNARGDDGNGKHYNDGRVLLPDCPIPGIKKLATDCVDSIIVSHRVNRKVRGQLHEETLYGRLRDAFGNQLVNENGIPLYVVRKPLTSITMNEAHDILDPVVRRIVLERIEAHGGHKDNKLHPNTFLAPLYKERKDGTKGPQIKRVRVAKASSGMQAIRNGTVFVETGSNDHIRLYPFDQSGKKRQYRVYTLFESAKAAAAADTDKDYVSFRINELYVHDVPKPGEKLDPWKVYRVQKINANDGRIFFRHHAAASLDDNNARLIKSPNTLIGVKQVISILGVPR
jgi:CRISPR-associated endonuclease Csn1